MQSRFECCAGPDGSEVTSQVVPVSDATKNLQSIMAKEDILPNLDHAAQHELVFLAHLPPVGYASCPIHNPCICCEITECTGCACNVTIRNVT